MKRRLLTLAAVTAVEGLALVGLFIYADRQIQDAAAYGGGE